MGPGPVVVVALPMRVRLGEACNDGVEYAEDRRAVPRLVWRMGTWKRR